MILLEDMPPEFELRSASAADAKTLADGGFSSYHDFCFSGRKCRRGPRGGVSGPAVRALVRKTRWGARSISAKAVVAPKPGFDVAVSRRPGALLEHDAF
jgi:hypothetical protein